MIIFKKSILVCLFIHFLSSNCFAQLDSRRMYFIGNSVTDAINLDGLKSLVESRGKSYTQGSQRIPGAPLDFLWNNPDGGFNDSPFSYPNNAFTVYSWDILSLQPFDRSIEGIGGDRETIGKYYNLIKAKSPECKIYIYGHWPRTPNGKSELECTVAYYQYVSLVAGQDARKCYEDLPTKVRSAYKST